ncbi:hypothetical protein EB796_000154 [Bugula neritina]|uniref:Tyrosine-protein phosphatase domain-containing protein n=1 Tax=Bugula neritina TaxID=10212 RepID=A0A7J7KTW4_BUGNE|nr:hypothetical protein EB796_000154 [Bugula neritina]
MPSSLGSKHPKPWMEENKSVSVSDLEQILGGEDGIMEMPSRAMDEVYSGIYIGEQSGASRSATVVLAYLMVKENKSVTEATRIVREKREICPNRGFLRQLCDLQERIDSGDLKKEKTCSMF